MEVWRCNLVAILPNKAFTGSWNIFGIDGSWAHITINYWKRKTTTGRPTNLSRGNITKPYTSSSFSTPATIHHYLPITRIQHHNLVSTSKFGYKPWFNIILSSQLHPHLHPVLYCMAHQVFVCSILHHGHVWWHTTSPFFTPQQNRVFHDWSGYLSQGNHPCWSDTKISSFWQVPAQWTWLSPSPRNSLGV